MDRYRKKPIVFETIRWSGTNSVEIIDWIDGVWQAQVDINGDLLIETLDGVMKATQGDFIIKGIKGEFYPCKPDIFLESYERDIDMDYG